ncbi:hypothetical protein WR25_09882 [Diploscapter pachys]|uniref:Phospholipid/glycerol acyltransferase domain-containing protein n=1 Tax=Diploscapter pachys TaxID=2018661 RepID=A0A2A2JCI7_9BILA|nr:hypothetical protein WR25_09882 [Diploscapter pachys]
MKLKEREKNADSPSIMTRMKTDRKPKMKNNTMPPFGALALLTVFCLVDGLPVSASAGNRVPVPIANHTLHMLLGITTDLSDTSDSSETEIETMESIAEKKEEMDEALIRVLEAKRWEEEEKFIDDDEKGGQILQEIRSSLFRFVCKICAWVLYKVFCKLMSKFFANPDQIALVQQAEKMGIPIVYLPLHRSHLDYLLITWCNWNFGLRLPHIASRGNLNLGGFGWLLRATGAFFIRRRVDPSDVGGRDALYRVVLHSYIEQLLKISLHIEFLLEGTRSRFGKALVPKHGLISNVVEAVQPNIIQDVYLVPVSYTYDNIAEGIFLNELMGIPKTRESFVGVIGEVWKEFRKSQPCGMVRMHYGRPIRLTELVPWVEEHETEVSNRALIRAIGYHAVHEAQSMMSIPSVSILSALLLNKYRDGAGRETLELDVEWLCERVLEAKREVMGWVSGVTSGEHLIEYALKFVKDAVKLDDDQIIPIRTRPQLLFLTYKRNALVPVFGFKAVIGKFQNFQEFYKGLW